MLVDWLMLRRLDYLYRELVHREMNHQEVKRLLLRSWVIEAVFELVRSREFPSLPSRLGSIHVFRDENAARQFTRLFHENTGYLYTCAVKSGTVFDTYMEWPNIGFSLASPMDEEVSKMTGHARAYWSGVRPEGAVFTETLVDGTVEVGELVAAIRPD